MTEIDKRDWHDILVALERRLEALTDGGVNWLSVSADPALSAVLERAVPGGPEPEVWEKPPPQSLPPVTGSLGAPQNFSSDTPVLPQDRPPPPGAPPTEPPHPSAIDTLESLRFQYRDCQKCPLGETRNHLVFGAGSGKPRLFFIGEGPGAEEDQQGLPFVGRAGALLTGLIEAMGLVREDVYITNVVKCRPPGNRNPALSEVASCHPILDRQIELLDPALIVTLGNVPLKALNPSAGGITRERGRIFHFRQWRVLPTFHPSYLLRKPGEIGVCWNDFRQALMTVYPEEAAG